jgi:ABC-type transport system involved in multi-copper enzyme maturation permease subunit
MQFALETAPLAALGGLSELSNWMVPIWTLCMGILVGMALSAVIYGIVRLAWPNGGVLIEDAIFDGLLKPFFYVGLVPAALALIGFPLADYGALWDQFDFSLDGVVLQLELGPDAWLVFGTACFILILFLVGTLLRILAPRVSAIALTTSREGAAQPLFWVSIALGAFALLVFIWLPYNTFGEDLKMLKETGLELMMLASVLLAVATASTSIADELEGKTALTLLSKPISRRQFILGKFIGVIAPVLLLFFILGLVFLGVVSYKTVYDGMESGDVGITALQCQQEMVQITPGLLLTFMQTAVLAAISVAISTRLPMLANLSICVAIWVLGMLVPLIVQSSAESLETVGFVGQLIATVLPVLQHFNMHPSIAGGVIVPASYLWMAALYCVLYVTFALLGALVLFEDRDLA